MNPISMLKNDHRKVERLFHEFETASGRAFRKRQKIARKVCTELEIHSQLEEQLFYPAVRMTADAKGQDLLRAAIEEHHVVQTIIDELNGMSSENDQFGSTFKKLAEHVEHHIREEERDLLSGARDQLGQEKLKYLGDQMVRRKRELTPPHPSLLRDTLRQAKSFVTMAYDALTGFESAKPPARRIANSAPKRRIPNPKQVVRAKAKRRSQSGQAAHAKQPARFGDGRATSRSAPTVRPAVAKARAVVKKGAPKARHPKGVNVRAIGSDLRVAQNATGHGRSAVTS